MARTAVTAFHHTETTLVLALASIAAGLLVEDIGSRIESRFLDKRLGAQPAFSTHSEEWNQYLRLVFKTEPVGQRYLRAILLRFKFELGASIALLSSSIGLLLSRSALLGRRLPLPPPSFEKTLTLHRVRVMANILQGSFCSPFQFDRRWNGQFKSPHRGGPHEA